MDITPLFKACIKTVKTRNKTFGIQSPINEEKPKFFRSKPKNAFTITARDITSQITRLRDFLLEHRERYLSFLNDGIGEAMSETERDQIDTGAQRIINTCSHLIKEFRNDNRKLSVSQQSREYMDAVIDLIDSYLKSVCKIHSELKALRVKRTLDIRKLSRLELPKTKSNTYTSLSFEEDSVGSEKDKVDGVVQTDKNNLDLSVNDVAIMSDEGQLSAEELQMFESENVQLLNELNSMTEEVRQIESKVLHIAELQEIFTEKVLQQEQDIDRIANTVVGATENVKDANEQIKQAIQRNAGLRADTEACQQYGYTHYVSSCTDSTPPSPLPPEPPISPRPSTHISSYNDLMPSSPLPPQRPTIPFLMTCPIHSEIPLTPSPPMTFQNPSEVPPQPSAS